MAVRCTCKSYTNASGDWVVHVGFCGWGDSRPRTFYIKIADVEMFSCSVRLWKQHRTYIVWLAAREMILGGITPRTVLVHEIHTFSRRLKTCADDATWTVGDDRIYVRYAAEPDFNISCIVGRTDKHTSTNPYHQMFKITACISYYVQSVYDYFRAELEYDRAVFCRCIFIFHTTRR
jgi:hypothetical protein